MDRVEADFRRVEGLLDGLLKKDEERLRSSGLHAEDCSARTYHYKNAHLSWFHMFRREWVVDVERARITVGLRFGEPALQSQEPPTIELTWRAELFRQGQESSTDNRGAEMYSLRDLEDEGIAAIVTKALAVGAASLPTVRGYID